jgi:protein-L-isoaspartate(D-aspartate) O-methyltransferase
MARRGPEDLVHAARGVGVGNERVLDCLRRVPRAGFVPPEAVGSAYLDEPVAIAHGQVTTQPSLVAAMVAALGLAGHERVLEIGTGLGFQTALLACLAAEVWSIERFEDLVKAAQDNLADHGVSNAYVEVGDGSEGLVEHAPYDAIVVSAAFPSVPRPLVEQLAAGGRLVQPIGPGGGEDVVLFERQGDRLERLRSILPARFVRLHGRHGYRT